MPTYEYRCPKGHEFEVFQRMSDEPRAECPECGKVSERLLSAGAGFLFKGDGFYITDYRSESYREKEKAEKKADGGVDAKADGKKADGKKADGKKGEGSAGDTGASSSSGGSTSGSSDRSSSGKPSGSGEGSGSGGSASSTSG